MDGELPTIAKKSFRKGPGGQNYTQEGDVLGPSQKLAVDWIFTSVWQISK